MSKHKPQTDASSHTDAVSCAEAALCANVFQRVRRTWRCVNAGLPMLLPVLILLLPFFPVPEYWIALLDQIGLYAIVAIGLVLLTGIGGMTSFGQAAFVGLGAYATAYLSTVGVAPLGPFSPWLGLLAGLVLTGICALGLGLLTMRLSGHFLPLGTIAWGLALFFLFGNLEFLKKYDGITGIPPLRVFGYLLETSRQMATPIWLCVFAAGFSVRNLLDSRLGRAIRALNGRAAMAEAMGVHTGWLRVAIFVYAALLAALSGFLFAHWQRTVNPTPFSLTHGIEYLFMAVVGGIAQVWGAVLGAAVVTLAQDWLQSLLPRLLGQSGNFEIIVFGILMVLLLQYARQGLWALIVGGKPGGGTGDAKGCTAWRAQATRAAASQAPTHSVVPETAVPLTRRTMPAAGSDLLEVCALEKSFGGLRAIDQVSFQIPAAAIVGLIGPNGAGKSTVFNLISGALRASGGAVRLRGERIDGLPARGIAARGVARTFQHVQLLAGASVLDNTMLGAHQRRAGRHMGGFDWGRSFLRLNRREEAQLRAEALHQLARVGLSAHSAEEAGTLALGLQRLVEIARALCSDPLLLLLDEPAAGLRYQEKQELATLLRQLRAEGMSILLVEHDMDFVMQLADQLVVLDFGRVIAQASPAEIQTHPAVRAAYLGEALEEETLQQEKTPQQEKTSICPTEPR